MEKSKEYQAKELAFLICDFLEEKKALRITLLDLAKVNPYFDYFLIASANSPLHLRALTQDLSSTFTQKSTKSQQNSSLLDSQSGWVIIDFVDIVVHLFLDELRNYYNLERLWGDADILFPK